MGGESAPRRRVRRANPLVGLSAAWHLPVALGTLVVGSMLCVGTVHVAFILLFAALAIPVGALAYLELTAARQGGWQLPCAVLGGLSLFCALQATPLPAAVVHWLSPTAWEVWQDALRLLGETPKLLSLSVDPGASWIESVKWAAYTATFLGAVAMARRLGPAVGAAIVFGSGVLAASIATLHFALGATALYGVYEPRLAVSPWRVAPLLNPNNFSGYLLLATFAGVGLLMLRRPLLPRGLTFVVLGGVVGVLVLTGSRGGVVALLGGASLLVILSLLRGRGGATPIWRLIAAPVGIVVFGVALAALAASRETWLALQDESLRKFAVAGRAVELIRDYWLTGAGRGAFDGAFPPYRPASGRVLFQYPENFVVQWLSEWGVPVGVAALGALLWSMRPRRLLKADSSTRAIMVGCIALMAQNLVDLGLEVMSVGLAFSVLLGTLVGGDRSRVDSFTAPLGLAPRRAVLVASGFAVVLLVVAFWRGGDTALAQRFALGERYRALDVSRSVDVADFDARLRRAVRRYPGDPYFPLLGALLARKTGKNALPWLNRALSRDGQRGAAHLVLADVLAGRGAIGQAAIALRSAAESQPELAVRVAEAAARWATTPEHLLAAVPDGAAGVPVLIALANLPEAGKLGPTVDRASLLRAAVARDPKNVRALTFEARDLVKAIEAPMADTGRCAGSERASCLDRLEADLKQLDGSERDNVEGAVLRAKLLRARGRTKEAEQLLAARCAKLGGATACLRARVEAALETQDNRIVGDAMTAFLSAACDSASSCAAAASSLGDMCAERGRWDDALTYYSRAVQENPTRGSWSKLARAAEQAGQKNRAREAALRAQQSAR